MLRTQTSHNYCNILNQNRGIHASNSEQANKSNSTAKLKPAKNTFEFLFKMVHRGTTQIANTENCTPVKGSASSCIVELVAKGN